MVYNHLSSILFSSLIILLGSSLKASVQNNRQCQQLFNFNDSGKNTEFLDPLFLDSPVQVTNLNGQPIAFARVLMGSELNNPFPGNEVITDENGWFKAPKDWKTPLPITVQADGYVRKTFLNVSPDRAQLELSPVDGNQRLEVKGLTKNYGELKRDGLVDFSLVIPLIKKEELIHFDVSQFVSPESDVVEVPFKTMNVPSNFALPLQKEKYLFFNITFDKPTYRLFVREPGDYSFLAAHGRFPLKKLVDEYNKGRSLFEMMNHFEFLEFGERQVTVHDGPMDGQDMEVNQVNLNSQIPVQAATFPNNLAQLTVALLEKDQRLYPTDIKSLSSGERRNLKTTTGQHHLLSVLRKNNIFVDEPQFLPQLFSAPQIDLQEMSLVYQSGESLSRAPQFLSLISPPILQEDRIELKIPTGEESTQILATLLILSEVEKIPNPDGTIKSEIRTRLWEVYSPGWLSQVELPHINWNPQPNKIYRWEALYIATDQPQQVDSFSTKAVLEAMTHVTRNATEF